MLKSSDTYVHLKGTITVKILLLQMLMQIILIKKVIFKNCILFTSAISEINNAQIDNAKDIDIVMLMYNLIEYSDNNAKTSGSLRQYCKDIPAVNNSNNAIVNS